MKALFFALALLVSSQASADMSVCGNLKVQEDMKNNWKIAKTELETNHDLPFNEKLRSLKNISTRGLRLLYMLDRKGLIDPRNEELISQVNKIIKNVQKDAYTKDASVKMLSHTLPKLQGALDNTVFQGQLKNSCETGIKHAVQVQGVKSRR